MAVNLKHCASRTVNNRQGRSVLVQRELDHCCFGASDSFAGLIVILCVSMLPLSSPVFDGSQAGSCRLDQSADASNRPPPTTVRHGPSLVLSRKAHGWAGWLRLSGPASRPPRGVASALRGPASAYAKDAAVADSMCLFRIAYGAQSHLDVTLAISDR